MSLFHLDDDFIRQFVGKQPKWGPIGYVTYKRTYARDLDKIHLRHRDIGMEHGLRKNEEFWLTLTRVVEGTFGILRDHCKSLRLPWDIVKAQMMAQEMFSLMWNFKFLPPGRGLWMMGTPALDKVGGASANNCMFVSSKDIDTDFSSPFCTLMDFSMLGVGVGGDTRGAGKMMIQKPVIAVTTHVVDDSREGWVAAIRRVLDAYAGIAGLPEAFDFSQVRRAGEPIKGFGGTASGPEPLRELIDALIVMLDAHAGKPITSQIIVDIFNLIGRCVVAGNVRRSAELMLGEPVDEGFLELKDREKYAAAVDGWRWASNNSIMAVVGQRYGAIAKRTAKNGEPGYFWLANAQHYGRMMDPPNDKDLEVLGTNPCSEQSLFDRELCCLVETFPFAHANVTDYKRTLKMAYLYAKTVTLVPTHDPRTNAVTMKNRRIGCSMSGIVQAMSKFGRRGFLDMCDKAYGYVCELDKEYSGWLCVPESIKKTSVKPSGTVSLLPQATPGIHHPIAEHYWRVIRFASDSHMLPALRAAGYYCEQIDPAKEPNTTAVYFPVKEEGFERGASEVSMWEQLELAAALQAHWADNQVSVTITFDKVTEGPQIARALELYETRLKGVSFLPHEDHGYEHAPYQPITAIEYETAVANLRPLDLSAINHEVTDAFCDGDSCTLPRTRA